jgi:hypothetical protein
VPVAGSALERLYGQSFSLRSFDSNLTDGLRLLKIIFNDSNQKPQIPFPILSDPFVWIGIEFI